MPTYERLDYGSSDGSQWGGVSTDRIGFFGATPIVQSSWPQLSVGNIADVSTWISNYLAYLKIVGLSG